MNGGCRGKETCKHMTCRQHQSLDIVPRQAVSIPATTTGKTLLAARTTSGAAKTAHHDSETVIATSQTESRW